MLYYVQTNLNYAWLHIIQSITPPQLWFQSDGFCSILGYSQLEYTNKENLPVVLVVIYYSTSISDVGWFRRGRSRFPDKLIVPSGKSCHYKFHLFNGSGSKLMHLTKGYPKNFVKLFCSFVFIIFSSNIFSSLK